MTYHQVGINRGNKNDHEETLRETTRTKSRKASFNAKMDAFFPILQLLNQSPSSVSRAILGHSLVLVWVGVGGGLFVSCVVWWDEGDLFVHNSRPIDVGPAHTTEPIHMLGPIPGLPTFHPLDGFCTQSPSYVGHQVFTPSLERKCLK